FDLEDLPFVDDGFLPLRTDPKLAWAQIYLTERPVEINRAEKNELLRIPGIGPKGAEAILSARRKGQLRDLSSLRRLGIDPQRVVPFVLMDGKQVGRQLALFQ
ncbi:MAG: helix-hairpin-helix domain-containing protein, partial [Chloroflexi bacterium]|nr:helix-hairpin-helix domain-containing protein [Chloroflexota bacterium]